MVANASMVGARGGGAISMSIFFNIRRFLALSTAIAAATLLTATTVSAQPIVSNAPSQNQSPAVPLQFGPGCSQQVCIIINGPNGKRFVFNAQVYDKGQCLLNGTLVVLDYGPSPSTTSTFRSAKVNSPSGYCQNGFSFPIQLNLNDGWWLCGGIQGLPGKPCGQVKGAPGP